MRAILLSYGIFVHTANVKIEPLFFFIEGSSGLFRMNTFFFLSGLLAALTIGRATPASWLQKRVIALSVPLLFGLLILNPLFFLLHSHVPKVGFMVGFVERNRLVWHLHLWFLFPLLAFTMTTFAIRDLQVRKGRSIAIRNDNLIPDAPHIRLAVLAALLAFPALRYLAMWVVYHIPFRSAGLGHFSFIISMTFGTLPFYLLGYLLPNHRFLQAMFSSPIYWLVGLLSIPLLLARIGVVALDPKTHDIVNSVGSTAFSLAFIVITTPVFLKITSIHPFLTSLSKSSYTIYIVHFLLVSMFLYAYSWAGLSIYPAAAATVISVFIVALTIHSQLVERHRWARFLLNGKMT
nr:acyltransferase family protein [uncultured Sphingomonas sp.]